MSERASRRGGGKTVLVVDDEAVLRQLIRVNLEADGYRVRAVKDGDAALAAARAGGVDAVITDLIMPGLDGWELCRALRDDRRTAHLPIVALSIASADRTRALAVEAILGKPFDYRDLRAALERILAAGQPDRATRNAPPPLLG